MSTGSFCSKRPVVLNGNSVALTYRNEFGTLTSYGSQPSEVQLNRWYVSAKTPSYKRIKNRDLPVNNFQAGARIRYDTGGTVTQKWTTMSGSPPKPTEFTRTWNGTARWAFPAMYNCFGNAALSYNSLPTRTVAEQKVLSKCKNMKINIAQSFAERKQTANLLITNVNRFVTFAVLVRKGKFSAAKQSLGKRQQYFLDKKFPKDALRVPTKDTFANLWLEYSYGWRPLLSDIYGAAELLAQQVTETRPTFVVASHKSIDSISSGITEYGVSAVGSGFANCWARSKVGFDIDDYGKDLLKQTGISNPILLAWELLPYSFVVDWFIPVGTYLGNLDATNGLKFVKGNTSVKTDIRLKSNCVGTSIYDYQNMASMSVIEQTIILDRYKLSSFPTPVPPKFDWGFNRLANAVSGIALLNQIFRK